MLNKAKSSKENKSHLLSFVCPSGFVDPCHRVSFEIFY